MTRWDAWATVSLRRDLIVGAVLLISFGFTVAGYDLLRQRFWLLLSLWTVLVVAGVALLRQPAARTALLPLASVLTVLLVAEFALFALADPLPNIRRDGGCNRLPTLQTAAAGIASPSRVHCRKYVDDKLIYDVVFGFDADRLRQTPGDPRGDTIIFFGCSYTFGTGLSDDETLPYFLSQQLGFRFNVLNVASDGYGPHQMLRDLERGLPERRIGKRVRRVFYVAIPSHVHRASGLVWWGQRAPRYIASAGGEAQLAAESFSWPLPLKPPDLLRESRLAAWIWDSAVAFLQSRTASELDLFEAILRKSSRLLREQYGVPLTVVLWDDPDELTAGIHERLARLGLEVVLISDVIAPSDRAKYMIPNDSHPAALANRLIAARLALLIE